MLYCICLSHLRSMDLKGSKQTLGLFWISLTRMRYWSGLMGVEHRRPDGMQASTAGLQQRCLPRPVIPKQHCLLRGGSVIVRQIERLLRAEAPHVLQGEREEVGWRKVFGGRIVTHSDTSGTNSRNCAGFPRHKEPCRRSKSPRTLFTFTPPQPPCFPSFMHRTFPEAACRH